ncbi:hypothetical protein ACI2LF_22785 [Kribbella sp. NPDC020789]
MELIGQQGGPGLAEGCPGDLRGLVVFDIDEQLVEEELIRQSSDFRSTEAVDLVAAPDEGERPVERVFDPGEDDLGCGENALCLTELLGDPILLLPSQIFGDRARHDSSRKSAAFLI